MRRPLAQWRERAKPDDRLLARPDPDLDLGLLRGLEPGARLPVSVQGELDAS